MEYLKLLIQGAPEAIAAFSVIVVVTIFLRWMKEHEERVARRFEDQSKIHYATIEQIGKTSIAASEDISHRFETLHQDQKETGNDLKNVIDRNGQVIQRNTETMIELKTLLRKPGIGSDA